MRGRPLAGASVGPDVILRAARRTFAKRGYDATSVREVARELGVDAALIAHHFGTKETLWLAVVEQIAELAEPMFDALRALRTSPLPQRDRVRRAIELCVDHEFDEPAWACSSRRRRPKWARGSTGCRRGSCARITT